MPSTPLSMKYKMIITGISVLLLLSTSGCIIPVENGETIDDLKFTVEELEETIDELEYEKSELESRVGELEDENSELDDRVSELELLLDDYGIDY